MTRRNSPQPAKLSRQEREVLAEWTGFRNWIVALVPPEHRAAAADLVDNLPDRDRQAAKDGVLALLAPDTCPAVLGALRAPLPPLSPPSPESDSSPD